MKTVCVLQHTEAEYLGLIEDHLEGRNIRFNYRRPFTSGGTVPKSTEGFDGLILLGAGPLGIVSGPLLPSLAPELRLTEAFLAAGLPVVGVGIGACLLSVAASGGAVEAPLRFTIETARRTSPEAFDGHLPDAFPMVVYMRDRFTPPADSEILAVGSSGAPLIFQKGNAVGFLGHPGIKSAMVEDLIMEFEETPAETAATLEALRAAQADVAAALAEIMVGLVAVAGWM